MQRAGHALHSADEARILERPEPAAQRWTDLPCVHGIDNVRAGFIWAAADVAFLAGITRGSRRKPPGHELPGERYRTGRGFAA